VSGTATAGAVDLLQAEAWAALRATPEDGARFATAVGRSLSREAHFVDWKGRPRVDPKAPRDPKAPDQPKVGGNRMMQPSFAEMLDRCTTYMWRAAHLSEPAS
jgi:hypothetical protein